MGTVIVRRRPRRDSPDIPSGEVILDPPPEIPEPGGRAWTQTLMVLPMLAGAGAMALMYSRGAAGPLGYVLGGMFGLSALGIVAMGFMSSAGGPSKKQMIAQRRAYMRHLALHRKKVQRTAREQREAMYYRHPDPDSLWTTAASHRLWERRPMDADFGVVRIGTGPQTLATPIVSPQTRPLDELEPLCAAALRRFVMTYSTVDDLPIAMAVNGFSRVLHTGDRDRARAMVRAALCQLAVHHAPDDLLIAVCAGQQERDEWEWVKWLPHATHPDHSDALGRVRMVSPSVVALEAILEDLLVQRPRFNPAGPAAHASGPHIVVVIDGGDLAGSSHLVDDVGLEGVTVLDLSSPRPRLLDPATLVLEIDKTGSTRSATKDLETDIGIADQMSVTKAEALARQLAPLRISVGATGDQAMTNVLGLAELLGLGDPYAFDVKRGWTPRATRNQLRVPIGVGPDGLPVDLDLKESAQDGMGPHGLLIGATGSGKSELLRTLVLALATSHSSESLNFVLVDFKGGATFTKLDRLPHTSAVITNLSDELPLVDRMTDAINGELLRRQELLRSAGNYSSVRDYEKARLSGAPLAPLPSLLIICDEFSELLSAKPDFIDMFVQIGRVGRSLGVHLLLASQRLEEGRLRGLDTHLSYRISLRTFSAMESRVVIGTPDAFELPRAPGHGYIKFGTEELTRFRAAYVSGTYQRAGGGAAGRSDADRFEVLPYDTYYLAPKLTDDREEAVVDASAEDDALGESLLDVLVDRVEGQGPPAHRVWLPPLDEAPTLDQLYAALIEDEDRGLTTTTIDERGTLRASIGVIDKPLEQRRDTLQVDLAGGDGHIAVVGGPQSGKSTALRTIITSLALTHTPQEVQFYCIDLGGGALSTLRDVPHVGGIAGRRNVNQIRRSVAEMRTLVDFRERRFSEEGIDSMATYRRRLRAGQFPDDHFGDAFLVVDGWSTLRSESELEELEIEITNLATRSLAFGVHVIVATPRWMDIRPALRDLLGTKVELRLGDPADSMLDRRAAVNVPANAPGRGITSERLHMLTGLPRIDGDPSPETLPDGVAELVERIGRAWTGPAAPRVRLLPDRVEFERLAVDERRGLAVGLSEDDLQAAYVDLDSEPHFIVFGDVQSGKTNFLRQFGRRIIETHDQFRARIMVIDYRRSLLGALDSDHMIGYGSSAQNAYELIEGIVPVLRDRLPPADITPEQLRDRSWWKGGDLYLLVDDYDMVASGNPNPLAQLVEFLPQARDIGLHLILTRRSGGASRALYEPVIQRLTELSSPGLILSGDRMEGTLIGSVRPDAQPPGRGRLVTRKSGVTLVQVPWWDPLDPAATPMRPRLREPSAAR